MKTAILPALALLGIFCFETHLSSYKNEFYSSAPLQQGFIQGKFYRLHYDPVDKTEAEKIARWLDQGHTELITFFSIDFKSEFDVYIFSIRDSLDAQWQKDWNMPGFKSQCWMVASGIGHRLDILSPRVWQAQACEHDSRDEEATRKLVLHELIHVFHGQHNPSPTFDSIVNMDWFVEGLAVYASGQLDKDRYDRARSSIRNGQVPEQLAELWKGADRYGFAGSMVQYIDIQYGRDVLTQLMGQTKASDVLEILDTSEVKLMEDWTEYIKSSGNY